MALFPAYAQLNNVQKDETGNLSENKAEWLENSSFKVDLKAPSTPDETPSCSTTSDAQFPSDHEAVGSKSESDNTIESIKRKKKEKRKKAKRRREKPPPAEEPAAQTIWDDFRIDKTRTHEFLTVKTISRPAVPKYTRTRYYIGEQIKKSRRRTKLKRYFHVYPGKPSDNKSEDEVILTKSDLDKNLKPEKDEHFTGFKEEKDMLEATASYNKRLGDNPNDVELWLKYIAFQDAVFQFEKTYRKGSIAKGLRITAERKIAIIDKALTYNPSCEALLRERLNTTVGAYPADELQEQMKKYVEKDQGNIILWQGYIEATQCSMSHCNTPAVLNLYIKCLSTLHRLRRTSALDKSVLEESILRMLYQCGLFLKQAGLFEQLWTLLRLYLELNLSPTDKHKFNINANVNEKQLVDLEEVVLNSQLPIHELWLRIEKLRESCHWLPYLGDELCEDPQRIVFTEDVAELIHPITLPENTFKLTATILTLLKVPLMPCRHTTMQDLGLDYVPWALDSIEIVLPMFLPLYPVDLSNANFLKDTQRLAVGPQYLKTLPGQEEYLEFLLQTIRNCTDCLSAGEKKAVTIWWFRFQKLLVVLDKQNRFKMTTAFKKKLKNAMKNLLKADEHRNDVTFYQEYALFEQELGNFESALNILITAITLNGSKPVSSITDEGERADVCSLYRNLIEMHLNAKTDATINQQKAVRYLVALALGKDIKNTTEPLTQDTLNEASLKFKHVTLQLLENEQEHLSAVLHFLPNFFVDWIICNGWFLYLTKGSIEAGVFIENTLMTLNDQNSEKSWQKEVLFEFYVTVLFKQCIEQPGSGIFKLVDDVLCRAVENYPNNLYLLSVLAKLQSLNCSLGQPWWKIKNLLLKSGHSIPILFLVLIANQRLCDIEESWTDTVTGKSLSIDTSFNNRMLSLFRRITRPDMCTRRCGLVWRLYLQFLHANFDLTVCRKAYYGAVDECPWLKALYIDAAIYIPAELPQIQDLLIEKQLRLHVTPEELDILRN